MNQEEKAELAQKANALIHQHGPNAVDVARERVFAVSRLADGSELSRAFAILTAVASFLEAGIGREFSGDSGNNIDVATDDS